MKCHKSCLPNRNPGLMAHVKWLTIMDPIYLYFVVQLGCKGKFSPAIIDPGPDPQEVQASTAPLASFLSHSISLGYVKDTILQITSHTTAAARGHMRTLQCRAQVTWSLPLITAHWRPTGEPRGLGTPEKKVNNNNIPCHANVVL